GTNLVVLLEKNGIVINGFIESKKKRDRHYGYNVYEIQELYNPCISMGIVLALNEKNALEVKKELTTRNLRNIKSEDLSWAQDYILHKSLTDWL
ncbi:MAG: hypothetical protein IJ526_01255, partial [Lachnospiraceae bacterium]|nr:hypothetical protein [Lachnospiraceae bacterium]